MSGTGWQSAVPPVAERFGVAGWLRLALRGAVLGGTVFGGLAGLLLLRLIEWPVHGSRRPWTPYITQGVCRVALAIIGLPLSVTGLALDRPGAVVANHGSWLDIFVLNAADRITFVSKVEVAGWPGIGWLARATGTVFIRRDAREATKQKAAFEARLAEGHRLLFFPEGTSTDSRRVLPFKPTLFAAFLSEGLRETLWVQPVTVVYHAPEGGDLRFYGWWGDMDFGPHLAMVLAAARQGRVELHRHPPVRVADFPDRKALARACEAAVRSAFPAVS